MLMVHGLDADPSQRCLTRQGATVYRRPSLAVEVEMVGVTARKVGRIVRLWPGRAQQAPSLKRVGLFDSRTDLLPPRSLTAAKLIAMARAACRPEAENPKMQI
jgi:hypothetical protein